MKRKTRNIARHIITAVLTLAIALTGVSFGDATTAYASLTVKYVWSEDTENMPDLNGTTVTMKPGDTKEIGFGEFWNSEEGWNASFDNYFAAKNIANDYIWRSSDEKIVRMDRDWMQSDDICDFSGNGTGNGDYLEIGYVTIEAVKARTAIITAENPKTNETLSLTVTVETPKMTAKQRKCKHSWKTTKKATCIRGGMKTCKKCKLQKYIARKAHNYETVTAERYEYTYKTVYVCRCCTCDDPELWEQHKDYNGCPNACQESFDSEVYGSDEAAHAALIEHYNEAGHVPGYVGHWFYDEVPTGRTTTYKEVQNAQLCGYEKSYNDLVESVNEEPRSIPLKDM